MHRMLRRSLMAGISVLALAAVSACARNASVPAAGGAGSSGMGADRNATASGTSGEPTYGVQPQSRRAPGNAAGAGVPAELPNKPPSQTPSTLSGDSGKRTTGEPGGN